MAAVRVLAVVEGHFGGGRDFAEDIVDVGIALRSGHIRSSATFTTDGTVEERIAWAR